MHISRQLILYKVRVQQKSNEIKNYISITGKFRSIKVHISSNIWQYITYYSPQNSLLFNSSANFPLFHFKKKCCWKHPTRNKKVANEMTINEIPGMKKFDENILQTTAYRWFTC